MPAIYTRTGDKGDTGLFGGSRVPKQGLRVEAYGSVDEGNAALGFAKSLLPAGPWRERVHAIQQRMFVLAAELASDAQGAQRLGNTIGDADVSTLERLIDDCLEITGPQRAFVVPGRDQTSAAFHSARTVLRRAERQVLRLAEAEEVRSELIVYLNRLSDAVYALARLCETWADQARIEAIVRSEVARALGEEPTGLGPEFGLATAKRMAEAAEAKAAEIGVPIVFAATDAAGHLLVLHRMPEALLGSIDIATNKAWTAAAFKAPSGDLGELARRDGPLFGLGDTNGGRVVLLSGGFPIFAGGCLAGAIGVSGGTAEQDGTIAAAAMAVMTGENNED